MHKRFLALTAVFAAYAATAPAGEENAFAAPGPHAYTETGPAVSAVRRITSNSPANQRRRPQEPQKEVLKLTLPSLGDQSTQPRYRMVEVDDDGGTGALKFNFENSVPIQELSELPLPDVADIAVADRLEDDIPHEETGAFALAPEEAVETTEPWEEETAGEIVLFDPTQHQPIPAPPVLQAPPVLSITAGYAEVAAIPGLDPPEASGFDKYNQLVLAPKPELDMLDLVNFDDDPNWTPELAFEPLGTFTNDVFDRQPAPDLLQVPPPIVRDYEETSVSAMVPPQMDRHPKSPKTPVAMVNLNGASPESFSRGRPPLPSSAPASTMLPLPPEEIITGALRPPPSFESGERRMDMVPSPRDLLLTSSAFTPANEGAAPASLMPPSGLLTATPSRSARPGPAIQDYGLSANSQPSPRQRREQAPPTLKEYTEIEQLEEIDGFTPMREVKFF